MDKEETLQIVARSDDRGYALIANFDGRYVQGWKMAVPDTFREALDIRLTPRKIGGKTEMLWTQGHLYTFKEGDSIYDTSLAYEKDGKDIEWGEALKHIKLGVQVLHANPSVYVTYETVEVEQEDLAVITQTGKKASEQSVVGGLVVRRQRIDHGFVKFQVERPNKARTKLEPKEELQCTQDDFVAFLQTGKVRTNRNKYIVLL